MLKNIKITLKSLLCEEYKAILSAPIQPYVLKLTGLSLKVQMNPKRTWKATQAFFCVLIKCLAVTKSVIYFCLVEGKIKGKWLVLTVGSRL